MTQYSKKRQYNNINKYSWNLTSAVWRVYTLFLSHGGDYKVRNQTQKRPGSQPTKLLRFHLEFNYIS